MAYDMQNCFCAGKCRAQQAIQLNTAGEMEKAFNAARNATLDAPNCPYTHGILAYLMNLNGNAAYADRHIHASKVLGDYPAVAETQLGHRAIALGDAAGAEAAFNRALMLNANHAPARAGLAKALEIQGRYDQAADAASIAYVVAPDLPQLRITYGKSLAQLGRLEEAIGILSAGALESPALYERGRIFEKLEQYDSAFADYTVANQKTGKVYGDAEAAKRIGNHKMFSTRTQLDALPRLTGYGLGKPVTPLFITGFPRSGTTLFETMLSAHPRIQAGDELPYIHHLAGYAQAWLQAGNVYPFALNELAIGDKAAILQAMRAYYTGKVMEQHAPEKMYMTDKMPLNEMHLPFISILFPEAPIFYMRRHPLDIIISNYSTFLTHGFNQSFDLVSAATHYDRVDDLLLHYKNKVQMNFEEIRYERLIADPEPEMKRILAYCALPYRKACIQPELSANHPRTPSYEAVKQPLNDKSIGRWRKFEKYMGNAMRIVEPILIREGY